MTVSLCLSLAIMPASFVYGQSSSGGQSGGSSDGRNLLRNAFNPADTASIVANLRAISSECGGYDPVYRIDCLRQGFAATALRIPRRGEYREIRAIIEKASRDLRAIVSANADATAPKQASRPNARFKQRRSYTAVKRQNLNRAMQQAQAVVAEAETRLLRSSENSEKRYQHYQQVAAAVGSNKVLLRSSA